MFHKFCQQMVFHFDCFFRACGVLGPWQEFLEKENARLLQRIGQCEGDLARWLQDALPTVLDPILHLV